MGIFTSNSPIALNACNRFSELELRVKSSINNTMRFMTVARQIYMKPKNAIIPYLVMQKDKKNNVPIIKEYLKQNIASLIIELFS